MNIIHFFFKQLFKVPQITFEQPVISRGPKIHVLVLNDLELVDFRELDVNLLELLTQGVVGTQLFDDIGVHCEYVILDAFHLDIIT